MFQRFKNSFPALLTQLPGSGDDHILSALGHLDEFDGVDYYQLQTVHKGDMFFVACDPMEDGSSGGWASTLKPEPRHTLPIFSLHA